MEECAIRRVVGKEMVRVKRDRFKGDFYSPRQQYQSLYYALNGACVWESRRRRRRDIVVACSSPHHRSALDCPSIKMEQLIGAEM